MVRECGVCHVPELDQGDYNYRDKTAVTSHARLPPAPAVPVPGLRGPVPARAGGLGQLGQLSSLETRPHPPQDHRCTGYTQTNTNIITIIILLLQTDTGYTYVVLTMTFLTISMEPVSINKTNTLLG